MIDLDHNATTRLHPDARDRMKLLLDAALGNPSSVHGAGRAAREVVERARDEVAALLSAGRDEIVLCSSGTESDNLAVRGAARAARASAGRSRVVSSPVEHPAVIESVAALAAEGFAITWLPVDGVGRVAPEDLTRALAGGDVALVTVQSANHEIGTCQPVAELAAIARRAGALFHTDAVQAAGKLPLDVRALGVDLLSIASHKIHGPRGAAALFVRRGVTIAPLLVGGKQERGLRAGTEDPIAIAGFGAACALAGRSIADRAARVGRLRDRLEAGALALGARRLGGGDRIANTSCLAFPCVDGRLLVESLDLEGIAASSGAACSSGTASPSPVVRALGLPDEQVRGAVRFSLGADNDDPDIDRLLEVLPALLARIRSA